MSTWNGTYEGVPDGGDSPSTLDNTIKDLKTSIEGRIENEHDTYVADGTTGAEAKDWRHKEGSARAYYQSAEPTNQPGSNGAALGADDDGRMFVDSDTNEIRIWDGSTWVSPSFHPLTALSTSISTRGALYDAISDYVPVTGDGMGLWGSMSIGSRTYILTVAARKDATYITIYGIGGDGSSSALPLIIDISSGDTSTVSGIHLYI